MNIALIHINAQTRAAADVKAGYSDEILIAEISDFATIAQPVFDPTVPGSSKAITTAHTFPNGKGFTELRGKQGSAAGDGDSIGEVGGTVMQYKPKITVVGDSDVQCEYIENLLYKEVMIQLPPPDCNSTSPMVQMGGKCSSAVISKVTLKTGSKNSGGLKEYEIEFSTFDKFFYSATVTKKP